MRKETGSGIWGSRIEACGNGNENEYALRTSEAYLEDPVKHLRLLKRLLKGSIIDVWRVSKYMAGNGVLTHPQQKYPPKRYSPSPKMF